MPRPSLVHLSILFAAVSASFPAVIQAQQTVQQVQDHYRLDLSITYSSERTAKANTTSSVWLQGGSIELGVDIYRGFGMAANITGLHTDSIGSSGVPFSEVTATFGPRYRHSLSKRISIYGQGLIGEGNAFDSVLPGNGAAQSGTNSLAVKAGGGMDYRITPRFAIRVMDAAWVRTQYPNSTDNHQNDLRLGAGIVVRFGR